MFQMTASPAELIVRALLVFAFVFVVFRVVGKKHVGELAPDDLVVLLLLSECLQNALVADDKSLPGGFIAAATLFGASQIVGHVTWRSRKAERILEGVPRILIRNGVLYESALAHEQITKSELLQAMRREGVTSFSKVRYAILENDGTIAVAGMKEDG